MPQVTSGGGARKMAAEFKLLVHPVGKAAPALDAVLADMFAETQALTHVITGELKASGHTTSESGEDTWMGEIIYGSPMEGDEGPAYYAIYEQARGGDHDFYRTLPLYDDQIKAAIKMSFK